MAAGAKNAGQRTPTRETAALRDAFRYLRSENPEAYTALIRLLLLRVEKQSTKGLTRTQR